MKVVATALRDKISSLINGMEYEFVGCEWSGSSEGVVLRIYIDSQRGISVDDCAKVSRQVETMLDVANVISEHYLLEVSSPGIDRPLFEITHYQKQLGKRIKLSLRVPMHDRRRWAGTLSRVEQERIYLLVENVEMEIPFSNIEKANVIANIDL